jgi:hypothetical protein
VGLDFAGCLSAAAAAAKLNPVAVILDRNDQHRTSPWQQHTAQSCSREAAYQRPTTTQQAAQRDRSRDQEYGLEL